MSQSLTEMDYLLLADLSYLNVNKNSALETKYEKGELTIGELAQSYNKKSDDEWKQVREKFSSEEQFNAFKQRVEEVSKDSSKFHNWKVADKVDNNDPSESGLVGYTFVPQDGGQAVVAFRGSESMDDPKFRNDWHNNGTSVFASETIQQKEAREYMQHIFEKYDNIAITGHSLGGNDGLHVTLSATEEQRQKITDCVTFNAPGFNQKYIDAHQEAIDKMKHKISEYQNENDMVSSLLNNPSKPIIIESDVKKDSYFLDPFKKLVDNHNMDFMATEDGGLKRKVPPIKNLSCQFISNVTHELEMVPDVVLNGFVETVFAVWNGRIDGAGLLKGAAVIAASYPAFAIAAVTVVLATVAAVLVVAVILTLKDVVNQLLNWSAEMLYRETMKQIELLADAVQNMGVMLDQKFEEFKRMLFEQAYHIFSKIAGSLKKWTDMWKHAASYSDISVNIAGLRNLASRLQAVQSKIVDADRRMDTLISLVDVEETPSFFWLDFKIGYNHDLKKCIDYLTSAADELEQCESKIMKHALAF